MREKLLILMKSEHLTASKLAELLGIQPSGISHILGGRNKPSFDLVQKILRRFPQVNPDWLLLDRGEMYRVLPVEQSSSSDEGHPATTDESENSTIDQNMERDVSTASAASNNQNFSSAQDLVTAVSTKHGKVKRVIILFEDHTFESYEMQR